MLDVSALAVGTLARCYHLATIVRRRAVATDARPLTAGGGQGAAAAWAGRGRRHRGRRAPPPRLAGRKTREAGAEPARPGYRAEPRRAAAAWASAPATVPAKRCSASRIQACGHRATASAGDRRQAPISGHRSSSAVTRSEGGRGEVCPGAARRGRPGQGAARRGQHGEGSRRWRRRGASAPAGRAQRGPGCRGSGTRPRRSAQWMLRPTS